MDVSIIVPVYNVAQYLAQCLESIGVEQFQGKAEIILVDDGSTDGSSDMCDAFAAQHNNVQVIHKSNGGLSDARNAGMNIARGDFIYFLDSDDWLAPNAIDKLYHFARENGCEIVQGGFYYAFDDRLQYDSLFSETFVLDKQSAMEQLVRNKYLKNFAWGKLYKTNIVKHHPFPIGKYYEDSFWQHHIFHEISKLGFIPEPLYYYRQRANSISGNHPERLIDLLEGNEQRLAFIVENYPDLTSPMADKLWNMAFHLNKSYPDIFAKPYQRITRRYHPLLSDTLRRSLHYRLRNNTMRSHDIYELCHRLRCRFKPKRFLSVPLQ